MAAALSPERTRAWRVEAPDGVSISVHESGDPDGIEVLFVHGFLQCHRSWARQLDDPALGRALRMVAYDVRGHGDSGRPMAAAYYQEGERFADEMDAVMRGAGLKRPVVVAWSYGTRIVGDYLVKYGDAALAGIDFVAAVGTADPAHMASGAALIAATLAEDALESERATAAFLRACFERPPALADLETMLGFNMKVPPPIRAWLRRPAPYEAALRAIGVPTLVTHGVQDRVLGIGLGRTLAEIVPTARASFYEGVGHAPFWEDAPRFNAELLAFARSAAGAAT